MNTTYSDTEQDTTDILQRDDRQLISQNNKTEDLLPSLSLPLRSRGKTVLNHLKKHSDFKWTCLYKRWQRFTRLISLWGSDSDNALEKTSILLTMLGSIYVSDLTVWRSFYENMMEGKFNPGQYRGRQRGGGGGGGLTSLECMLRNLI